MAQSFRIDILIPEGSYFSGEILSLSAPGLAGYLGVLGGHAPLVTPLAKGKVELRLADHSQKIFTVDGGFLEVASNQATLLVEKITSVDLPPP
ncbi:ATP synthase epsilon chain [Gammaproteobacteria bacterium]